MTRTKTKKCFFIVVKKKTNVWHFRKFKFNAWETMNARTDDINIGNAAHGRSQKLLILCIRKKIK